MSDFDDFMAESATEAAAEMNDVLLFGALHVRINSVFEEQSMEVGIERYGDTEEISAIAVVPKSEFSKRPTQKTRVTRLKDGVTYYIMSVNEDSGHYELELYREGNKIGNG